MAAGAIDQFMQQVADLFNKDGLGREDAGAGRFGTDLQRNFRAMPQAWLRNLDVVSREEFEAQRIVLAQTRARLESLERQITELERTIAPGAAKAVPPETGKDR